MSDVDLQVVRAQPAFLGAMRDHAATVARLHRNSVLLNTIVSDRGRMLITSFAAYLDARPAWAPDGLTAAGLKALCVEQGVASPGRVAATIALMRWGGFVDVAGRTPDGSQRLAPTPRLIGSHLDRWRAQLPIVARIYPDIEPAVGALDDPAFVRGFMLAQGGAFVDGFRFVQFTPELELFFDRNSAWVTVMALAARGGPGPHPFSASAISRAFHVSRPHVTGMVKDAEANGLLVRDGDVITLTPRMMDALERFFAAVFLLHAHCARAGLTALNNR